jgi:hypothetical protein
MFNFAKILPIAFEERPLITVEDMMCIYAYAPWDTANFVTFYYLK